MLQFRSRMTMRLKPGVALALVLVVAAGFQLTAQNPVPTREFIYLGDRVIAVENNAGGQLPSQPNAPSQLVATRVSGSEIHLEWIDNSTNETAFKIERKIGANGTYAEILSVVTDTEEYNDTGLSDGSVYYYRVRTANGSVYSGYSNDDDACTCTTISGEGTYDGNGGLVAYAPSWAFYPDSAAYQSTTNYTDTQNATASFSFTGATVTWYGLRWPHMGKAEVLIDGNVVGVVDQYGPSQQYQVPVTYVNLGGGNHTITVRVLYEKNASSTAYWVDVDAIGVNVVQPPAAPSSLSATAASSTQINLTWTDNSGNETGFKIERKTGAGGQYTEIDTVPADTTSYQSTGLDALTTYYYRVRSYNAGGDSAYSNEDSATTLDGSAPTTPQNLTATFLVTGQIRLTFAGSDGNQPIEYEVWRKQDSRDYTKLTINPPLTTVIYDDYNLGSPRAYAYKVRAKDAGGVFSEFSNVDLARNSFFTDDPLIAGVTTVQATHITQLRTAVDSVRSLAGLSAATWTDSSLSGVVIKAVHVEELRTNLSAALTALGFPAPGFTDPFLTGVPIKKVHIEELRLKIK